MSGSPPFPVQGRLLGVDPGTVRIGLAVCDAERRLSSPLENYRRRGLEADAQYFRKLIRDEEIVGLVIGLPISLNDSEGPKARQSREFADWLQGVTGLPYVFQDERYTTHYANDLLENLGVRPQQRKGRLDAIAAQVILHIWLETAALDRTPPRE